MNVIGNKTTYPCLPTTRSVILVRSAETTLGVLNHLRHRVDHPLASEVEFALEIEEMDVRQRSPSLVSTDRKNQYFGGTLLYRLIDRFRAPKQNWSRCGAAWCHLVLIAFILVFTTSNSIYFDFDKTIVGVWRQFLKKPRWRNCKADIKNLKGRFESF